jgi:hypothetical protein
MRNGADFSVYINTGQVSQILFLRQTTANDLFFYFSNFRNSTVVTPVQAPMKPYLGEKLKWMPNLLKFVLMLHLSFH